MNTVYERPVGLLTAKEAAEALHISISTLYVLIERGELKRVKIGRAARFRPRDINRLMDRGSRQGR